MSWTDDGGTIPHRQLKSRRRRQGTLWLSSRRRCRPQSPLHQARHKDHVVGRFNLCAERGQGRIKRLGSTNSSFCWRVCLFWQSLVGMTDLLCLLRICTHRFQLLLLVLIPRTHLVLRTHHVIRRRTFAQAKKLQGPLIVHGGRRALGAVQRSDKQQFTSATLAPQVGRGTSSQPCGRGPSARAQHRARASHASAHGVHCVLSYVAR